MRALLREGPVQGQAQKGHGEASLYPAQQIAVVQRVEPVFVEAVGQIPSVDLGPIRFPEPRQGRTACASVVPQQRPEPLQLLPPGRGKDFQTREAFRQAI